MSPADLNPDVGRAQAGWIKILDRIEHRQPEVGLRFWGLPLWLEVTMTGPDSDLWPAIGHPTAWDWQSSASCVEVADLANEGADDDRLLAVVARYTIENLILNAVHEIGEWFRFDGRRLFPAHNPAAASDPDDQGNGAVSLQLEFGTDARRPAAVPASPAHDQRRDPRVVRCLAEAAAPSRFTYMPGTTISYEATGPLIQRWSGTGPATAWRSTWSSSTLEAVAADGPEVVQLVGRDVHSALVLHEADRICRAFHVDGRRLWTLAIPEFALGPDPCDTELHGLALLSIGLDHPDTSSAIDTRACRLSGLVAEETPAST